MSDQTPDSKQDDLLRELQYYKKLSDEVAGYNIQIDSQISTVKRKLHQKENGFAILSSLHDVFGHQINHNELFDSTIELINTTLKMDRSLIAWKGDGEDHFLPKWFLGYDRREEEILKNVALDLRHLTQSEVTSMVVNKSTPGSPEVDLIRRQLFMNYFITVPIRNANKEISGFLFSCREKEAWPFYPTLDKGELDTLLSISGFMEAALANESLYRKLEKANQELEAYNRELEQRVMQRTRDLAQRNDELAIEKKKSDDLLLNILPEQTAEELKKFGYAKARHFEEATVLFTDFVGFTIFTGVISADKLVAELDYCFRHFDEIITRHGLEKIKTIGDAHMSVGGITGNGCKPWDVVNAALEIRDWVELHALNQPEELQKFYRLRIGLHTGPVVAGVVGIKKFSYDIWGDTVNTASRMQSSSEPGKVNISEATYQIIREKGFAFEHRGKIAAKNKSPLDMYFVEWNR
jgi:class 3 adenylate cyclase